MNQLINGEFHLPTRKMEAAWGKAILGTKKVS